jgi:hypothetical protein
MRRPGADGFTLVETIFSTLFISLTVLAIVNLFPGAYLSVKKSETRLQSDIIAKSILEDLRATAFTAVPFSSLGTATPESHSEEYESLVVDGIRYFPTVTVYNLEGTDPRVVKGVSVKVDYRVGTLKQSNVHETILHSLKR